MVAQLVTDAGMVWRRAYNDVDAPEPIHDKLDGSGEHHQPHPIGDLRVRCVGDGGARTPQRTRTIVLAVRMLSLRRPAPHSKQVRQRRRQRRIMGAWRSRTAETRRREPSPLP